MLRASGGPSILKELSNEQIAVDMEDAQRLNVAAVAVQVFIGGEFESQSVHNMTRLVDIGNRYGIPVLGVTAVGRELVRDAQYMRLASRICAELGASFVKTYYVERGLRHRRGLVPGADRDRRRQENPGARCARDGHRAVQEGALGRRHGPQHLPVRASGGDDPGGPQGRARRRDAEAAYDFYRSFAQKPVRARAGRGALIERQQG